MQVKCVEPGCGNNMLERHEDTDRNGNPVQWYRCKNLHWRAISIVRVK